MTMHAKQKGGFWVEIVAAQKQNFPLRNQFILGHSKTSRGYVGRTHRGIILSTLNLSVNASVYIL